MARGEGRGGEVGTDSACGRSFARSNVGGVVTKKIVMPFGVAASTM